MHPQHSRSPQQRQQQSTAKELLYPEPEPECSCSSNEQWLNNKAAPFANDCCILSCAAVMECVVQRNCIGNVRKQAHKRCWAPLVDARLGGRQMETNDEVFFGHYPCCCCPCCRCRTAKWRPIGNCRFRRLIGCTDKRDTRHGPQDAVPGRSRGKADAPGAGIMRIRIDDNRQIALAKCTDPATTITATGAAAAVPATSSSAAAATIRLRPDTAARLFLMRFYAEALRDFRTVCN